MTDRPTSPPTSASDFPIEGLSAFHSLFDGSTERLIPLPARLDAIYGPLRFPIRPVKPHFFANFVSSLDGVVALNAGGVNGGGEISGGNRHDRFLMGLLRGLADIVVVGSGTLRGSPRHLWTPGSVAPSFASAFAELRSSRGLTPLPGVAIVSASGDLDLGLPVFRSALNLTLVLTTLPGQRRLLRKGVPVSVKVRSLGVGPTLSARSILDAVVEETGATTILTEGGPRLLASFLGERVLDELFLTLAPQVAGRDPKEPRPGFAEGKLFAPVAPAWATLVGVKRAEDFLFLRYSFET